VGLEFHDNDVNTQSGYFTFNHRDANSQTNGASFHFSSTEPTLGVIVDGPGGYYADTQLALRSNGDSYMTGGNLGIGTNSPSDDLHVRSNTDASIWLEADADNATESDNPYLKLTQDGQLVNGIIGLTGANGVDPEGNSYTNALNNGFLLGTTTNAPLQLGMGNNVRFTIATSGYVGVGTTAPNDQFTVEYGGTATVAIGADQTSTASGFNALEASSNNTSTSYSPTGVFGLGLYAGTAAVRNTGVYGHVNNFRATGVLGVRSNNGATDDGWGGLFVADLGYTGGVYNASDARLKRNIQEMSGALDVVRSLRPVRYFYDTDKFPFMGLNTEEEFGFIAQDVNQILPNIVKRKSLPLNATRTKRRGSSAENQTGEFYMIDYSRIIPLLTQALKEQQELIEEGDKEREEMKARIEGLEQILHEIRKDQ
jgi:hypothetical protein